MQHFSATILQVLFLVSTVLLFSGTTTAAPSRAHVHSHAHLQWAHRHAARHNPATAEMPVLGPAVGASSCCQGEALVVRMPAEWHQERSAGYE